MKNKIFALTGFDFSGNITETYFEMNEMYNRREKYILEYIRESYVRH